MISRKRILKFAIGKMLHQDGWAEKYDQDNRFGINQYDYDSEKDYLFALQREWKNSIWNSDKVEKYVNVLDHTSFDEYEEDVEECLARLEEENKEKLLIKGALHCMYSNGDLIKIDPPYSRLVDLFIILYFVFTYIDF